MNTRKMHVTMETELRLYTAFGNSATRHGLPSPQMLNV